MVDYEKGTPAWDMGSILTRHTAHVLDESACSKVKYLRETASVRMNPSDRLKTALETPCTCGAGDDMSERTSLRPEFQQ